MEYFEASNSIDPSIVSDTLKNQEVIDASDSKRHYVSEPSTVIT